jgi:hypothetical protein
MFKESIKLTIAMLAYLIECLPQISFRGHIIQLHGKLLLYVIEEIFNGSIAWIVGSTE